jgi:hypothetical protein
VDKAQARAAAERIEKGIDLYGAGDWPGAARELEEALKLDPSHARAQAYLGWVRELIDGKRTLGASKALDEDALKAVDDALADEPAPSAAAQLAASAGAKRTAPTTISSTTLAAIESATESPSELEERQRQSQIETRPGMPLPLRVLDPPTTAAPDTSLDALWDPVPLTPSSQEKAPPPAGRTLPDQAVVASAPPPSLVPSSADASAASSADASAASTADAGGASTAAPVVSPSSVWPTDAPAANAPGFSALPTGNASSSSPTLRRLPLSELAADAASADAARARRQTPSTLLGMPSGPSSGPAGDRPRLTPTPRPMPTVEDERPESVTREWQATPTGTNLPPLDVPELTDEQVHELLALDNPLLAAPRDTSPSMEDPRVLEFEAEPTPHPHLSPLQREPTTPDYALSEFDSFDETPTRERSAQLRAIGHAPTLGPNDLPDLNLLPLDTLADETSDSGRQKTNPFVPSPLAEPPASQRGATVHELPLPPRVPSATDVAVPAGVGPIVEALGQGDASRALKLSEELVSSAGGIEAESCRGFDSLLEHVYNAMLGGLDRRPRHGQVTPDLDPRSAFLLSRLDGSLTFDDLLDVSGMPRVEAMRILALMIARGVVLVE